MRTAGHLFDRLVSDDHLEWSALQTLRGKMRRPDAAWCRFRLYEVLERIERRLRTGRFSPEGWCPKAIRDPKPRVIAVGSIEDRIVHTAVVSLLEPIFTRSLTDDTFACRPGYGTHRALIRLLKLQRRHRWFLHLDVRSYFPSIDLDILRRLISSKVRDAAFLGVVDRILEAGCGFYDVPWIRAASRMDPDWPPPGRGLPIGALTSQLFAAHVYLNGLDHHVKRELAVPGYVRYVDDLVLFGDTRSFLLEVRERVAEWLAGERGLRLKAPAARPRPTAGTLNALGHAVTRGGIAPRPRAYRAFDAAVRRELFQAGSRWGRPEAALSIASRAGHILFP